MNYIENLLKGRKVEWKTLGEVCELKRGKSLSKSDKSLGKIPFILYGELYTTYGNYITSIASHTSEEKAEKAPKANKEDILLPISSTTKYNRQNKTSENLKQNVQKNKSNFYVLELLFYLFLNRF